MAAVNLDFSQPGIVTPGAVDIEFVVTQDSNAVIVDLQFCSNPYFSQPLILQFGEDECSLSNAEPILMAFTLASKSAVEIISVGIEFPLSLEMHSAASMDGGTLLAVRDLDMEGINMYSSSSLSFQQLMVEKYIDVICVSRARARIDNRGPPA